MTGRGTKCGVRKEDLPGHDNSRYVVRYGSGWLGGARLGLGLVEKQSKVEWGAERVMSASAGSGNYVNAILDPTYRSPRIYHLTLWKSLEIFSPQLRLLT